MQGTSDVTVAGMVVLPFGLLLAAGITLQVDEQPAGPSLGFRTCLPAGCMVSLSLDIVTLRAGAPLTLNAAAETGPPVKFSISLWSFAAALDRLNAINAA